MRVVHVESEAELRALKPAWDALLAESASNTLFLTWEWITAWWSAYGKPGELRILAAFDDQDVLRGIAPLRLETVRRYGQTVSALTFIGDGSNDSDYLDIIAASGYEEQVLESFHLHWVNELDGGTVLLLNEVPETSRCLPVLRSFADSRQTLWTEAETPCGTVHLPEKWETYLGQLRPRFRTKIRSVLRDLEGRPEVQFGLCQSSDEVRRMLPILFELHTRKWVEAGQPGVFGWGQKREFYFTLSELLLERGWLRLSWLKWNERVLACQYGFAYQNKYLLLQEGYEPASEHLSLGIGLRAWSIRRFLEEGLREYDFLGGRVLRHRSDWGAESKSSKKIQLARATYKNLLFCRGSEWEERARESAKQLIPEKILAARRVRQDTGSNGSGQTSGPAARSASRGLLLRKAAARCYFHSGLASLGRALRDGHQLSRLPRLSWKKREEPSARIFCYHRVNDDNDAFFPAISTKVFEQQIRFIARHYRVVTLDEMLDRLDEGPPEPVIAITFDDGYQDNYENAFPILQRYGVPATIFLSTGGIDSAEELWFSRLAGGIKRTAREFIDLEIDIPRRIWTRTEQEKLQANSAIFGLLRPLPDEERRNWLAKILQHLGGQKDGERGRRMLSWDQIRLMNTRGIHFGGHTVTHPFLSRIPREPAAWEMAECKRRIEQEIQSPVSYFAYPNGGEEDFGQWNKDLLHAVGYRAAVTTIWGMNYRTTDRMELRRGGPWETDPALFASKLDWYNLVNG